MIYQEIQYTEIITLTLFHILNSLFSLSMPMTITDMRLIKNTYRKLQTLFPKQILRASIN